MEFLFFSNMLSVLARQWVNKTGQNLLPGEVSLFHFEPIRLSDTRNNIKQEHMNITESVNRSS
jgi:hypothetical protein